MRSAGGSDSVVLACASDEHYVRPLAAMLRSAIDNLGEGAALEVHVLQSGIDAATRERITHRWPAHVEVNWIETQESAFAGLPLWGRMPVSTYYKLGLPDLLPGSVTKVLWLDCDVIVLDDLSALWDIPLESAPLGAVQDSIVPLVSSPCGIESYRNHGIDPGEKYFNAGVMIVDLAAWRRLGVTARAIDYLREHRESVTFWDQEGLNLALAGKWRQMDPGGTTTRVSPNKSPRPTSHRSCTLREDSSHGDIVRAIRCVRSTMYIWTVPRSPDGVRIRVSREPQCHSMRDRDCDH